MNPDCLTIARMAFELTKNDFYPVPTLITVLNSLKPELVKHTAQQLRELFKQYPRYGDNGAAKTPEIIAALDEFTSG